jgi:hypothetical protein
MGQRPNCRSCSHCVTPQGGESGWCKLRRLPLHPEWSGELSCHHWTPPGARSNEVPLQALSLVTQARTDHQLSLAGLLEPALVS